MNSLGKRLGRLEKRLSGYCIECHHCNPPLQQDIETVDRRLRSLVEAIEATIRCDTGGCTRRDDLRTL